MKQRKDKGEIVLENNMIKEELFTCERNGLTIRGKQFYPAAFAAGGKYPIVVASHGFTGNYTDMEGYCQAFARIGYMAFCFSFCGGGRDGEPVASKSDGKSTDMTVLSEVEDLLTVIGYAQGLACTDAGQLVLLGYSQGGFVSGLAAARCGGQVARLVMVSPALCIPDHARRGCLGGASYDPQNVPEVIDCGCTLLGRAFHEEVVGMEPFLELSAYRGKVLIIHGTEDTVVHFSYAVRAQACYQEGQCQLQLMRDQGHGYDEKQSASVFDSIRQFLADREEILSIQVLITRCEERGAGENWKNDVYFTGYCDTKYFRGTIMSEGCDAQTYSAETGVRMRAEYTLKGLDACGESCEVHIVNRQVGAEWKPVVQTNSKALAWLNQADLTAVLEGGSGGPKVRIFAERRTENR